MAEKHPGRPRKYASAAERQAAYRERVRRGESGIASRTDDPGQGAARLDAMVPLSARLALRRIARHQGVTQADVLTRLISSQDDKISRRLDDDGLDEYLALD